MPARGQQREESQFAPHSPRKPQVLKSSSNMEGCMRHGTENVDERLHAECSFSPFLHIAKQTVFLHTHTHTYFFELSTQLNKTPFFLSSFFNNVMKRNNLPPTLTICHLSSVVTTLPELFSWRYVFLNPNSECRALLLSIHASPQALVWDLTSSLT